MAPRKTNSSASTHHMKTRSQVRRERAEAAAAAAAAAEAARAAAEAEDQEDEDMDDDEQEEEEQGENEEVSESADEVDGNDDAVQDNDSNDSCGNSEADNDADEINSNGKRSRGNSDSPSPPKKPCIEEENSEENENDEDSENEDQDEDQGEDQGDDRDEDEQTEPEEDQGNDDSQSHDGADDEDERMTDREEDPKEDGDEHQGENDENVAGGPTNTIDSTSVANNSSSSDNNVAPNNEPQHTIIRDDYWPNIRPRFFKLALHHDAIKRGEDVPHHNTEIQIPCCVCHNLTLVPFSSEHYPAGDHDHKEMAAVLPCGHLIGVDCLTEWRRQSEFLPLPCPQCRHPLQCEDCFAPFCLYTLNHNDMPPSTEHPANPNENRLCNTCHSHNSFIVNTVLMPDVSQGIPHPSHDLLRQWIAQAASREYRELRRFHDDDRNTYAATFFNAFSSLRSEANKMQQYLMGQYPALQRIQDNARNQRPWNIPFYGPTRHNPSSSNSSEMGSNHSLGSFNSTAYPASDGPSVDSFNSNVYPASDGPSIDSLNSTVYPTSSNTSDASISFDNGWGFDSPASHNTFFEEAVWRGPASESNSDASSGNSNYPNLQWWNDNIRR